MCPELKIEPTFTIEHLAQRHRIEVDGEVERVPRETVFELILALDVPTQVPRLGVTFEVILIAFGNTAVHPFTGALWVTVIICGRMITFYRPNVCLPAQTLGLLANCIVR